MKQVLREYSHGLAEPQSFEEEIPAIVQLFTTLKSQASAVNETLEEEVKSLRNSNEKSQSTIQELQRSLTTIQSSVGNGADAEKDKLKATLNEKIKWVFQLLYTCSA